MQRWLDINGLSMNPDKTKTITIGTSARRAEGPASMVDLGSVNIKPASDVRSLGITIDDTLSFNGHVDNVGMASNFHLRALRHILNLIYLRGLWIKHLLVSDCFRIQDGHCMPY